jgi:WD40 repeat protein
MRVLEEIGTDPTKAAIESTIDRWLHAPERRASDVVTIYFAGHGSTTDAGRHYLWPSDYDPDRLISTAVPTESFAAMLEGSPVRQMMIIVDTCNSGQGAFDFSAFFARVQSAQRAEGDDLIAVTALGAALPLQLAREEVFSIALVNAIHDRRTGGETQQYLYVDSILEAMNRELPPGQIAIASTVATGRPRFFPNPRFRPYIRPATDLEEHARLRARARDSDLALHWEPRARGVEVESQEGWYFTGRVETMRELVEFLRNGEGMKVVTGTPGAGKSAVLGRLVTLALPEVRQRMPAAALPASDLQPPDGSIDVWIHAKGKTRPGIVREIHSALSNPEETHTDALLSVLVEIRALGRPFTILIDALDEAAQPGLIANTVLQRLAEIPRVRVIIGTRKQYLRYLGPAVDTIDLDDPKYIDVADIAAYVRKRLLAEEEPDVRTPYRDRHDLATTVANAVASRAFPNFLVARIVGYSLLAAPKPVNINVQGWDQRFPSSVGTAFDEYLARFGERETLVRDLFRPLAYAEGRGLPWDDLWAPIASALSDRPCTDSDIEWLLDQAAPYVIEDLEDDRSVYRLYHQALADHLRSSNASRAQTLQQRIVETLGARATRGWLEAHPYIRRHLASHAAAAGTLERLLRDPLYLIAADPARLQLALTAMPELSLEAHVYLGTAPYVSIDRPGDSLAALTLRARQLGAKELVRRAAASPVTQPWRVRWCLWRREQKNRLLVADSPISTLASGTIEDEPVIAAGLRDGRVLLWSLRSGMQLTAPLHAHSEDVLCVAIHSPLVISGDNKGELCISRILGESAELRRIDAHQGCLFALRVVKLAGEDVLVTAGTDEMTYVYNLPGAEERLRSIALDGHEFVQAMAAPANDGRRLVCGMRDGALLLLDLESGRAVEIAPADGDSVTAVAATDENGVLLVVTGHESGKIKVWKSGLKRWRARPLGEHLSAVTGLAVLQRDGFPTIVSGSEDGTLAMWRPDTAEPIEQIEAHEGTTVASIAVIEDRGKPLIVSAGQDRMVRIWPAAALAEGGPPYERHVSSLALCRVNRQELLATGTEEKEKGVIVLRDCRTGKERFRLEGHDDLIHSMAFAEVQDGLPLLVSASEDRTVRFWDLSARQPLHDRAGQHGGIVFAVVVARGERGPIAVTACEDGRVRRFDVLTGKPVGRPMRGHEDWVTSLAVIPGKDEDVIVSGSDDGTVRFWSAARGTLLGTERAHEGWVKSVVAGRFGGQPVVFSGDEEKIVVWDAVTRRRLPYDLGKYEQSVQALAITHGRRGDWLLAGGFHSHLHVYSGLDPRPRVLDLFAAVTDIVVGRGPEKVFVSTSRGVLALDLSRLFE